MLEKFLALYFIGVIFVGFMICLCESSKTDSNILLFNTFFWPLALLLACIKGLIKSIKR